MENAKLQERHGFTHTGIMIHQRMINGRAGGAYRNHIATI